MLDVQGELEDNLKAVVVGLSQDSAFLVRHVPTEGKI